MLKIHRSAILGLLAGVVCLGAQAASASNFSDRQLYPNSTPPAPAGNDLLLAENVLGSGPLTPPGNGTYPAETWYTNLRMGTGDVSSGITGGLVVKSNVFSGSGSTGVYPGTIGDGKHTEDTLADIDQNWGHGSIIIYQYVFHDQTYDHTTGAAYPDVKVPMPYEEYTS